MTRLFASLQRRHDVRALQRKIADLSERLGQAEFDRDVAYDSCDAATKALKATEQKLSAEFAMRCDAEQKLSELAGALQCAELVAFGGATLPPGVLDPDKYGEES